LFELGAGLGELVDVGRLDLALVVADVAPAEVVGEEDHDVRLVPRANRRSEEERDKGGEKGITQRHGGTSQPRAMTGVIIRDADVLVHRFPRRAAIRVPFLVDRPGGGRYGAKGAFPRVCNGSSSGGRPMCMRVGGLLLVASLCLAAG